MLMKSVILYVCKICTSMYPRSNFTMSVPEYLELSRNMVLLDVAVSNVIIFALS
jgi:hypothetical protein